MSSPTNQPHSLHILSIFHQLLAIIRIRNILLSHIGIYIYCSQSGDRDHGGIYCLHATMADSWSLCHLLCFQCLSGFFSHWDTTFQGPCNFHFLSPNHININCIALSFWNPISVDPVGDNHLHPWEVLWGFNSSSLLDQYDLHGNCDIDDCDIDDLHDNYDISDFTFVIYLLFKEYWKINNPKIKSCSWFFPLILKNIVTNSRF